MTDIATLSKTANRVLVGPGTSQRLVGKMLPTLWFERRMDPANWYTALVQFDEEDLDTAASSDPVDLTEAGAGTMTFVAPAIGATLTTGATENNKSHLHPGAIGKAGLAEFWLADNQPFIWTKLAVAPALLITNVDVTVGLADTNPGTAAAVATSGEVDAARFILESGASAANWFTETSVGGLDVRRDTGILSVANTMIELAVVVSKARKPYYFFNGNLIKIGPSLTAAQQMSPFVQVNAGEGVTKDIEVQFVAWGQRYVA